MLRSRATMAPVTPGGPEGLVGERHATTEKANKKAALRMIGARDLGSNATLGDTSGLFDGREAKGDQRSAHGEGQPCL
jgi:hypothetical protein